MSIQEETTTEQHTSHLYIFIRAIFLVFIIILAFVTYLSGHSATIVENNNPDTLMYQASVLLAPIFVHLIIANIVIIVLLCFKKSFWLLIPCLAIAINWHIIPSIIQKRDTSNTIESANAITLQTYNVHQFKYGSFNNTVDNILFSVHRNKVDILCLQEYSSYKDYENKKEHTTTIDDIAKHSTNLYKNKKVSQKSKESSFSKVFPYSCFSDQKNRMGLALFSRYPIVYSKTCDFPESSQKALIADVKINGKLLRIITVHLQTTSILQHHRELSIMTEGLPLADASFKWNALSTLAQSVLENSLKRKTQVDIICKLIKTSPHPIIVCGDMNDTPNSFTYYKFERLLNDAFKTSGSGYAFSYIQGKTLRIDYIFHSNKIVPMEFYYKPYFWSDHSAAFFRFSLPPIAPE